MDGQRRYEDSERMDIEEERRSTNNSPSLATSSHSARRYAPVLPRIVAADPSDLSHHGQHSLPHHREHVTSDPNSSVRHPQRPPYEPRHSFPPAPTSPRRYHNERYYDDRRHHEYPSYVQEPPYPTRPYSAVDTERHPYRETYPESPRDAYAQYPPPRPTSAFEERYPPRRSLSPPRIRPVNRDPRDRSPGGRYPHYPERRYPPGPSYYRDERDYPPRTQPRSENEMEYHRQREDYRRRGTPEHPSRPVSEQISLEDFAERANRYSNTLGRYVPPSRESLRDALFTFAHHRGHARGRSEGNGRDMVLPPAREILSVSPDMRGPTPPSAEFSERAHFPAMRQPFQYTDRQAPSARGNEWAAYFSVRDMRSIEAPEEILQSLSIPRDRNILERPPQRDEMNTTEGRIDARSARGRLVPVSDHHDEFDHVRRREQPPPETPHRSHVPSIQPRTGFPSSGLRSTAPATPPNPRFSHNDPLSFPPRFPGPSLAPLPPPPPRSYNTSHPAPYQSSLRPRVERRERSPPEHNHSIPRPASQSSKHRNKLILISTTKEDPSKAGPLTPGYRAKSPSQHIRDLQLPRLTSLENLPSSSARRCLVPPPERDELPNRTKEQNRAYSEWLFEMSSNVQRCLTKAVVIGETDLLKGMDELCVTTHWIVTYMHQLGLSYYSQSRHEMRIAFWWKLNWSWFCLIQNSYNIAISPLSATEINPFPNNIQLETDHDLPSPPPIKKEESQDNPRNADSAIEEPGNSHSPTPKSSDQDTISEPMEDVITSYNVPPRFQRYWDLAKRLNRRPKWPRELGSQEWIEVGDFIVEMGHELSKFGLLDLELGFWENEIMHRIGGVLDAWRRREMDIVRLSNEEFEKLGVEEKKVMIASIKEDDRRIEERRTR